MKAKTMSYTGVFRGRWWPIVFALPQLILVFLFFYWPALVAIKWSLSLEQPFGGGSVFVGLDNFRRLLVDQDFYMALGRSGIFMLTASCSSIAIALILAIAADRKLKVSKFARNMIFWPKAIAGAATGVVFLRLFGSHQGVLAWLNEISPGLWNPELNSLHAVILVNLAFIWNNVPFDFIILLTGLQAIPDNLHEAAALFGAGPWRRIWLVQLPLLTPQLFFCLVIEVSESLTGSFALIHSMTSGGPAGATNQFVYKIYVDGFKGFDLSGSSAESLILMALVSLMTLLQFVVLERRVTYARG